MKILSVILLLAVLGCAHRETVPPLSAETQNPYELSNEDVLRLQELARIRSLVGEEAWPGFGKEELGMVLVGSQNQWALDIDEPPKYYVKVGVPLNLHESVQTMSITKAFRDWRGELLPEAPASLYRAFSKEQTGNHYRQSVFFVKSLSEYHRTGDKMSSETWLHISLHELFHVYQDRYVKYTPEFMKAVDVPFKEKIRDDPEHEKLFEPELKLLAEAVCNPDAKKMKKQVKAAMKLRQKRWDYITKKYGMKPDTWERYDAWAEGTAYYVEHQIMSKWAQYAEQSLLLKDQAFEGFKDYKYENKEAWCETVGMKKKSYWYSLGFAYSLIMDRMDIAWKTKRPSAQFFDGYFKDLDLM
jgi:hypothetical protein